MCHILNIRLKITNASITLTKNVIYLCFGMNMLVIFFFRDILSLRYQVFWALSNTIAATKIKGIHANKTAGCIINPHSNIINATTS